MLGVQQQGNQLYITDAQSGDAGRYICVCQTPNGEQFESEYVLTVENPPVKNEVRPAKIEYAEFGADTVLQCNPDRYTSKYHWSRQQGHFAPRADISSVSLRGLGKGEEWENGEWKTKGGGERGRNRIGE